MFLTCFTKSVENQFLHIRNLVCRQDSFALGKFCGSGLQKLQSVTGRQQNVIKCFDPRSGRIGLGLPCVFAMDRGVWTDEHPELPAMFQGEHSWGFRSFDRTPWTNFILYIYGYIWWFPKIGAPPNHPFLDRIFQYKSSSYWGSPMTMETSIYTTTIKFTAGDLDRLS